MDEIIKAMQRFLARDLLYILGGGSVIFSALICFQITLPENPGAFVLIFTAGIAYVIGFAIQELISLTPFLKTAHFKPKKFTKWIYKVFNSMTLEVNDKIDNISPFIHTYQNLNERQIEQIERIINLKTVGAAMGSNWLVASVFLAIHAVRQPSILTIFMAVSVAFLGIFLLIIARVKGAQQMHMFYVVENKSKDPKKN